MEKEIGKINKNDTTDILVRVDDFGGKQGLTIREFVISAKYTGFTKAGVRILSGNFAKFKEMINSISEIEMAEAPEGTEQPTALPKEQETLSEKAKSPKEELPDY